MKTNMSGTGAAQILLAMITVYLAQVSQVPYDKIVLWHLHEWAAAMLYVVAAGLQAYMLYRVNPSPTPATPNINIDPTTKMLVCLGLMSLFVGGFTGCSTAGQTISAASTQVQILDATTGKPVVNVYSPKEVNSVKPHLKFNVKTGEFESYAEKYVSSSEGVITSAGIAEENSIAAYTASVNNLAAVVLAYMATRGNMPAVIPVTPILDTTTRSPPAAKPEDTPPFPKMSDDSKVLQTK